MTNYVVQKQAWPAPSAARDDALVPFNGRVFKTKNPLGVQAVQVLYTGERIEFSILENELDFYPDGIPTPLWTTQPKTTHWTECKVIVAGMLVGSGDRPVGNQIGMSDNMAQSYLNGRSLHATKPGSPPQPWSPTNPNPQPGPPIEIPIQRVIPFSEGRFRFYVYLAEYDFPIVY